MFYEDYEYEYHDIAKDADFIDEDECYYNDGTDEPWVGFDNEDNEILDNTGWENYYHNLTEEISED
jgi:hypothetical protein